MKPLRIDFAARGWRRAWFRLQPGALACGALGLLLCAGAAFSAYRMVGEQRARTQAQTLLAERQQRLSAAASGTGAGTKAGEKAAQAIPEAQAKAVNSAILQLNLPWRDMQDAVGAATPPTVALLSLEPDPRKRLLKITAEARNSDDMIGYIELLKQQEFFTGAALARHEINELDANRPIRFQVEAQWASR